MEVLYVIIYLTIISKGLTFNFGSFLQTLPPSLPDDFRKKIQFMYSAHPEAFGDSPLTKPQENIMRTQKQNRTTVLWVLPTAKPRPKCTNPPLKSTTETPAPIPYPIPFPIYPPPLILPMTTYFEPVVHDHPPLAKIQKRMKEDDELWKKYKKIMKKHKHSSSWETDDSSTDTDGSMDESFQYYEDFMHIKG